MSDKRIEILKNVRHLALDMDGTIYNGKTLFPFTPQAFELFEKNNIGYTYLTNNSSRSVEAYLDKLHGLGLKADRNCLYTSSLATLEYLKESYPDVRKIYVFGTESLRKEFAEAGYEMATEINNDEPELVVVGFDTTLVYDRMCKAAWWIKQGKPFIATHPDFICPTDQPTVLVDCGAVCNCITSATGVKPHRVLGKPDPCMITGILKKHKLENNQLAMVGDRLYTDMAMAKKSGVIGVLVLSGEATREDIEKSEVKPSIVVENILELAQLLKESRV